MQKEEGNENKRTCLADSWQISGEGFEALEKAAEEMDARTKTVLVSSSGISLITVADRDPDGFIAYLHDTEGTTTQTTISPNELSENGIYGKDQILSELQSDKLMLRIGGKLYPTTHRILPTLCQRAGMSAGGAILHEKDPVVAFHRDAAMARFMGVNPCDVKLVVREDGGLQKVFAAMSGRFGAISQKQLFANIRDIFESEMGASKGLTYSVDNYITDVYAEFPEKAKDFSASYGLSAEIIPGVQVLTSDTGVCSCTIYGTFRCSGSGHVQYAPDAIYRRIHTSKATADEIREGVEKSIFPEYTRLPKRLCELLSIDVGDPEGAIESVARQMKLEKIYGKKPYEEIVNSLKERLSSHSKYTAYDIAMMYIEKGSEKVAEAELLSRQSRDRDRSIFLQAAFCKY